MPRGFKGFQKGHLDFVSKEARIKVIPAMQEQMLKEVFGKSILRRKNAFNLRK